MEIEQPRVEESTLDESVLDTFMRDIRTIVAKLKIVFFYNIGNPEIQKHMEDWDLWGPLVFGIVYAFIVLGTSFPQSASNIFSSIVFVQWIGAVVLTIVIKLLGVQVSFFQMFSTLGYSIIPLIVCCPVFALLGKKYLVHLFGILPIAWCLRSVNLFLSKNMENNKRVLVLTPIAFYYYFFVLCLYSLVWQQTQLNLLLLQQH